MASTILGVLSMLRRDTHAIPKVMYLLPNLIFLQNYCGAAHFRTGIKHTNLNAISNRVPAEPLRVSIYFNPRSARFFLFLSASAE